MVIDWCLLLIQQTVWVTGGNECQVVFEYTLKVFKYQNKTNSASLFEISTIKDWINRILVA